MAHARGPTVRSGKATGCTTCRRCDEGCPEALEPSILIALVALATTPSAQGETHAERLDDLIDNNLLNCTSCGDCTRLCPSHLPLNDLLETGQRLVKGEQTERASSEHWKARFEKRQQRVTSNKIERKTKAQVSAPSAPESQEFSRATAQSDIAAAVARVAAKRAQKAAEAKKT